MQLAAFREALDGYRRPTGRGQQELARALGLHPAALSHKLHGRDGAALRHDEVRGIVRTLAAWHALETRAQAIELLGLMGLGPNQFSAAEWAAPPLIELEASIDLGSPVGPRRATAESTTHRQLPVELTPLVGRTGEVQGVLDLFDGGARLVSLTGTGGTGKTRLAVAAAAALAARSDEQVRMVALAAIRDSALVGGAIASGLGVRELPGRAGGIDAALVEHLCDQHMLLVLDNLEQLLGATVLIAEILRAAPGVRVLATSRVALRIYGEHEFRVPPLRLSPRGASDDAVLASEAVTLFVQRGRAACADFRPEPADVQVLREICARLDGLPLAIELAAARLRHLSLPKLLERLVSRLDVLDRGPSDVPARQRTLRATLDWSYDLLSDTRRRQFERMGVFVGGCAPAAVRAVCSGGIEDTDEGLWDLVDSALVEVADVSDQGHPHAERRFRMLETVREYALARLAASGDAEATAARHRDWCVSVAEQAAPELTGPAQLAWYARLTDELDNFRAAREYSRRDPSGSEAGLRLAAALSRYLWVRVPATEARAWLSDAIVQGPMAPTAARAQALTFCGQFDHLFGADANGRERLAQAVEIADVVGDGALQCLTKRTLALFSTDPLQARCLLEQAVENGRVANDQREVSFALTFLATACEWQGDLVGADAHSNQAVAAARASGDALARAQALLTRAELLVARGEFVGAQTALDEALTLSKALDHHYYLATIYGQLAWLALARGDPAFARAQGRMSLEAARASGAESASVETLLWAASVAIANGQVSMGVRWIAAAMGWQTREQTPANHTMWSRRWKLLGDHGALAAALDSARASLGQPEFDSIWAIGERLTLDEVLDEALGERG